MPTGPDDRKKKRSRKGKGRRARGDGSIFWNEERQRYVGRKIVGRTATGTPQYRQVSGRTKDEVVEKLKGLGPSSGRVTVREWSAVWLKSLSVRASTRAGYVESLDQHILPALGHLPLTQIKATRIETLAAQLAEKKLAVNSVRKVLDHARTMFAAAIRDELIHKNPVSVARRPKAEKKKGQPFTPAELQQIIARSADLSAGPTIALLAGTGCRLGEAAALDVTDWDPRTGKVSITKTYSKRFGLGPPKSKHSPRTITVPAPIRPILDAAAGGRTEGPLFVTGEGNRFIKSLIQRAFRRVLGRLDLAPRKVHQLRHSMATAMISAGIPLGDVAAYLGDAVDTLVRTYLHPTGVDPVGGIEKILAPGPNAAP